MEWHARCCAFQRVSLVTGHIHLDFAPQGFCLPHFLHATAEPEEVSLRLCWGPDVIRFEGHQSASPLRRKNRSDGKIGLKCKCPTALMNMSQLPQECCTKTRRQAWTVQKFWKMSSWIHFKEKLFVFKTRYESCCDERLQLENWRSEVMMWSCWKTRQRWMHTKANTLNKWVNKGGTMASQEVSFLLLRSVNGVGSCFEYWSLTSLQREAGLEAVCVHKLWG